MNESFDCSFSFFSVFEHSISDQGYFLRCLTQLLSHCPSIQLNNQIIHFYQQTLEDRKFSMKIESKKHLELFQCFNQLFQSENLSLRNAFIRIFTSQFVIELRHCDDHEEIISILNLFETLLAVVKPSSRTSNFDLWDFSMFLSFSFRYSFSFVDHSVVHQLSSWCCESFGSIWYVVSSIHLRAFGTFHVDLFKWNSFFTSSYTWTSTETSIIVIKCHFNWIDSTSWIKLRRCFVFSFSTNSTKRRKKEKTEEFTKIRSD